MRLTLPYPPTVNHIYRRDERGRPRLQRSVKSYRRDVAILTRSPQTITGRVAFHAVVYPPDRRVRDLDNVLKSIFDALTCAKVWSGDHLVDRIDIRRSDVVPGGRVDVDLIETFGGTDGQTRRC